MKSPTYLPCDPWAEAWPRAAVRITFARPEWTVVLSLIAAATLLGWFVVSSRDHRLHVVLQPLFFAVALLVLALAWGLQALAA